MDAPFDGDVADESMRSQGPSEESFPGFDTEKMHEGSRPIVCPSFPAIQD